MGASGASTQHQGEGWVCFTAGRRGAVSSSGLWTVQKVETVCAQSNLLKQTKDYYPLCPLPRRESKPIMDSMTPIQFLHCGSPLSQGKVSSK